MGNAENLKKKEDLNENVPQWVTESVKAWLVKLKDDTNLIGKINENLDDVAARTFYYKVDWDNVEYQIENVKSYLNAIKDKERSDLKDLSWAWILSVQIALESLWYEVGKIDGIYWKDTRKAVENFQRDNGLTVDGAPGKETIGGLINCLNGNKVWNVWQGAAATGQAAETVWQWQTAEVGKKSQEFTSENITNEEMQSYVDSIKRQCKDSLKINESESIDVSFEWKNLKFNLWCETYSDWGSGNKQHIVHELVDVKTCLKWWNPTDIEYWNVDIEYVKNSVIKEVKEKLISQKKAVMWWRALVNKYKDNWLKKDDIFKGVSLNDRQNWRINTFFKKFDDEKLVLDCDKMYNDSSSTKYEWDSIKLEFDDSWFNEKYNKWENNPDLIVKASEFVGNNYVLDESKFKEKLRWIILRIIEREDFDD